MRRSHIKIQKGVEVKILIALVMCFVLTSCSGTPSLSDSSKLIEYEKCLSVEEMQARMALERSSDENFRIFFNEQKKEGLLVKSFIEDCEEFRP